MRSFYKGIGFLFIVIVNVIILTSVGAVDELPSEHKSIDESKRTRIKAVDIAELIPQRLVTDISFTGGLRGKGYGLFIKYGAYEAIHEEDES